MKLIAALFLGIAIVSFTHLKKVERKEPLPFLMPPKDLKYFTLGYHEVVADSMWLRTIQDLDFCESGEVQPVPGSVDRENLFAGKHEWAPAACNSGWVYRMLDAITELAPKFQSVYEYGATALSVIVTDREGATKLFEKGVQAFPYNWRLSYFASYHMLFEEKNPKRAAELLIQAGKTGAPPWVFSLASRILEKQGQVDFARQVLTAAQNLVQTEKDKKRIQDRLKEIEAAEAVGAKGSIAPQGK